MENDVKEFLRSAAKLLTGSVADFGLDLQAYSVHFLVFAKQVCWSTDHLRQQ